MIYCFVCKDAPHAGEIRQRELERHLAHITEVVDHIRVAGPVPAEGGGYQGSIIMIEADTGEEARALFDQDPYAQTDMWKSVEMFPFSAVAGTWVGGIAWDKKS